jgi:hypothetical protein
MIKRIIGAAILLGTVNMAQAGVFIGTSYGWTSSDIENAKIDDKVPNLDYEDAIKTAETWGLRVGGDFDFMRVYVSYDRASSDNHGKNTQENLLLSADYLYQVEANTRLFAGLSAGATKLVNESATYRGYDYDSYSKSYGGQFGMIYDFEGWQLEGGYRILKHSSYERSGDARELGASDYFPSLNKSDQFYMALNYRF